MVSTAAATILFSTLLLLCVSMTTGLYQDKDLNCYFRSWSQYGRGEARFLPEDVNPKYCDVLKYAFLKVNFRTFQLQLGDDNDVDLLRRLVKLKEKDKHFKVVIAVGKQPRFQASR